MQIRAGGSRGKQGKEQSNSVFSSAPPSHTHIYIINAQSPFSSPSAKAGNRVHARLGQVHNSKKNGIIPIMGGGTTTLEYH